MAANVIEDKEAKPQKTFEERLRAVSEVLEKKRKKGAVAREFGVHPNTLKNWLDAYEESGEEGLIPKKRGRQPKSPGIDPNRRLRDLEREVRRLREENEILKKFTSMVDIKKTERFDAIHEMKDEHKVRRLCLTLDVSESGYYNYVNRPENKLSERDREDIALIRHLMEQEDVLDPDWILLELRKAGRTINRRRLLRLLDQIDEVEVLEIEEDDRCEEKEAVAAK
ncbi:MULTISPECIES: transposase [Bhargavaea]|uniref:Transposase n=1 Tax=Bhargavaea changchunensis TaxID=2134037 RepID=A0ABW2NE01_9BACL|nr:transposase [Bhargavaea sp. CC-171006]